MPANSLPRRVLKRALAPVLNEAELVILPHAVREGETVFDIGANYGLYAYHLGPLVGKTGKVFCFEPIPFTARTFQLVSRLLRFQNVELVEKGCSDHDGTVQFTLPVMDNGAIAAGLVHLHGRDDERSGAHERSGITTTRDISADVVTLDAFLPDVHELSLIKCDIEGADLLALRGARRLIERHHPTVICEINPSFLDGFGLSVDELVSFFTDRGYGMYLLEDGRLVEKTVEQVVAANWVFIHPERAERLAELLASAAVVSA